MAKYDYESDPASQLKNIKGELETIQKRRRNITEQLATVENEIWSQCKVLATTVYRAYAGKDALTGYDTVVVDEASMLMPPLVFYAAGLAESSVIIAGDFRQLPPIVVSDDTMAQNWLRRDVFSLAGLPDRIKRREKIRGLVHLDTQYRMREPICKVVNELFYGDNPLITDESANLYAPSGRLPNNPLLYLDTQSYHPWAALRVGTYSRYNLFHALLIRNIVSRLCKADGDDAATGAESIGCISPYTAQAKVIQALLTDKLGKCAAGMSATVHSYQGNEKTTVILDLTDSYGTKPSRFTKATDIDEDGARLLNVAISRAKRHIILVGNFDYLKKRVPEKAFTNRLIRRFLKNGEPLDLQSASSLDGREWADEMHRVQPPFIDLPENTTGVFNEGTFYPAFMQDIKEAQASIVILSPFASENGTARWVDALRSAIWRNVRVQLITKPPEEFGGVAPQRVAELVKELRRIGASVDLRAKMHEKIAIIDSRILWHGSLNILSHRDTHESMLRIDSVLASRVIGKLASAPLPDKQQMLPIEPSENPRCPVCNGSTIWHCGKRGVWFECEDRKCEGSITWGKAKRKYTGQERRSATGTGTAAGNSTHQLNQAAKRLCPKANCNGTLKERKGRHGLFWGCTNFPQCKHTENAVVSNTIEQKGAQAGKA